MPEMTWVEILGICLVMGQLVHKRLPAGGAASCDSGNGNLPLRIFRVVIADRRIHKTARILTSADDGWENGMCLMLFCCSNPSIHFFHGPLSFLLLILIPYTLILFSYAITLHFVSSAPQDLLPLGSHGFHRREDGEPPGACY